jgi:hypothetical protein
MRHLSGHAHHARQMFAGGRVRPVPALIASDDQGRLVLPAQPLTSYAVEEQADGTVVVEPVSDLERRLLARPDLMARIDRGLEQIAHGKTSKRDW